jgi:hypothetical protein
MLDTKTSDQRVWTAPSVRDVNCVKGVAYRPVCIRGISYGWMTMLCLLVCGARALAARTLGARWRTTPLPLTADDAGYERGAEKWLPSWRLIGRSWVVATRIGPSSSEKESEAANQHHADCMPSNHTSDETSSIISYVALLNLGLALPPVERSRQSSRFEPAHRPRPPGGPQPRSC